MSSTLNGGLNILSYSLEMDNGQGGIFVPVVSIIIDSLATTQTISTGVVKGRTYKFRYRARNVLGWGEYSPIGYILAAQKPSAP